MKSFKLFSIRNSNVCTINNEMFTFRSVLSLPYIDEDKTETTEHLVSCFSAEAVLPPFLLTEVLLDDDLGRLGYISLGDVVGGIRTHCAAEIKTLSQEDYRSLMTEIDDRTIIVINDVGELLNNNPFVAEHDELLVLFASDK